MDRYILRYFLIFLCIGALFAGIVAGILKYYSEELPPLSELKNYDMKTGSEVYDIDNELVHVFAVEKRKLTNVNELPPHIILALLATEDTDFYDHWGVNVKSTLRAAIIDIIRGSFAQGASTITQQLARNLFLTLDRQIPRKIKELLLAIQIEKMYSKEEILEMYFNKVAFGPGIYGIEAASRRYFGKPAKKLNLPEAALIVGMTQLPSAYYPFRYPHRAIKRRNTVLKRMYQEKVITKQEYVDAKNTPLNLYQPKTNQTAKGYFIEHIRKKLERKYGTTTLFAEGLKIYTTLDSDLQTYADSVLNDVMMKFEEKNDYEKKYADFPADSIDFETPYIQAGMLTIDAESGYVLAMIGGRNFNHSKFNRITQAKRQPGSAFKPILYSTAIDYGYTPATIIQDEPVVFVANDTIYWKPHNYSQKYYGFTRLRTGLMKSRNIFAVKTIYDIGPQKVVNYAKRFGLDTNIYPVYSLAIGTCEVKPIELISGYTTFPNEGTRVKPLFIRRIEDNNNNIIFTPEQEKIRVLDKKTAFLMANLMQSVVEEGTGQGVRWRGYRWTASGKTGTTDDYRDAWFIGYNKEVVTGIWVGFDDNSSLGSRQSGAVAALPAWPHIMKYYLQKNSPKNEKGEPIIDARRYQFTKPEGIITKVISKETGLLPKNDLEEKMVEYFIKGTEPTPISDSLRYNFYPTMYKENNMDSLVIDLGGKPKNLPQPAPAIDLRGAKVIKDHKYLN